MIDPAAAAQFVDEWIATWNRHDLDAVMSMCADDMEFESAFLVEMYDTPSGVLHGADSVRAWFARALENPEFHIDPPLYVLTGVDTIVLVERIGGVVAANVFTLDEQGRIVRSQVHG